LQTRSLGIVAEKAARNRGRMVPRQTQSAHYCGEWPLRRAAGLFSSSIDLDLFFERRRARTLGTGSVLLFLKEERSPKGTCHKGPGLTTLARNKKRCTPVLRIYFGPHGWAPAGDPARTATTGSSFYFAFTLACGGRSSGRHRRQLIEQIETNLGEILSPGPAPASFQERASSAARAVCPRAMPPSLEGTPEFTQICISPARRARSSSSRRSF